MSDANPAQGRNILVFADGTGNEGGLLPDETSTNVYKLFRATRVGPETTIDPGKQIAFYVSGIGTPVPGKAIGWRQHLISYLDEMVGGGLTARIALCYIGIISVWRPGDRIYLFGFSRGAYTVRCLAHVLEQLGIPSKGPDGKDLSLDPKKLYPIARSAVRILYFLGMTTKDCPKRDGQFVEFRKRHQSYHGQKVGAVPYFIGVWDTVAAMGMNRVCSDKIEKHLPLGVQFVRHAMAIDEYRKDYARVPWGGSGTIKKPVAGEPLPFEQIWFAGNHADIGGSYPENESRLSDITLEWIANFISNDLPEKRRVSIDWPLLNLHPSFDGMMHDECMVGIETGPITVQWEKHIRPVDPEGDLHKSVFQRLALPAVRNFDTYGLYRPANLRNHPKAAPYWEQPTSSDSK